MKTLLTIILTALLAACGSGEYAPVKRLDGTIVSSDCINLVGVVQSSCKNSNGGESF